MISPFLKDWSEELVRESREGHRERRGIVLAVLLPALTDDVPGTGVLARARWPRAAGWLTSRLPADQRVGAVWMGRARQARRGARGAGGGPLHDGGAGRGVPGDRVSWGAGLAADSEVPSAAVRRTFECHRSRGGAWAGVLDGGIQEVTHGS